MKTVQVRRSTGSRRAQTRSMDPALQSWLLDCENFESLAVRGYSRILDSPDVSAAVNAIADIIGGATIQLWRNTPQGDERVRNELSKFMDIHPWSMGTRQQLMHWIVTYLLTSGDGNAFVLPVSRGGYLEDLVPMPGAQAVSYDNGASYVVQWRGQSFTPDSVLHFVFRPDPEQPWRGRGLRVPLKDVLLNLKQSAATTNSFMSDKWKPSMVVKVDAIAEEFSTEAGRQRLLDEYIAGQKAGEPWVIPAGLIDVVPVKPLSLADLAISDTVQLDKRTVAAMVGVPPYLLGIGAFNRDEYNAFIRKTVLPLATCIAAELTKKLLFSPDMYFRVSERRLYNYSLPDLARVADDQYIRGIMTGNEVRDWLGLAPMEGLDERVILENYIPAGMIADQKKLNQEGANGN